ncbi:hypothetical protein ACHAPJ_013507 [Fusarium lateritium]
MKLNCLPKLREMFGFNAKSRDIKPDEQGIVGSTSDPSGLQDGPPQPDSPTTPGEVNSSGSNTHAEQVPTASAAQLVSPTSQSQKTPAKIPETVVEPSIWNRAYDSLKQHDEQLVKEYEELLSMELLPRPDEQNPEATSDRIDNQNLDHRQEQLHTITRNGLQQMEEGKKKYTIFGYEFVPRKQIAQAAGFVKNMKALVDEAVKASPEASLAWAGVCTVLPLLTNPAAAEEAQQEGFTYVTSRMRFYVELEHLLWPASLTEDAGVKLEFENDLVNLYQHILEFQLRLVLRLYETRLRGLKDDVIKHGIWEDLVSKIRKLEDIFHKDLDKINGLSSRTELENLNKKADQFLHAMTSILSVAMGTENRPANTCFDNYGSGHQFNATGGTQNNNVGGGQQFTGATFTGAVQFGRK